MKIEGTIALVTGASSGIGEATAKAFAKKGSRNVLLLSRTEEQLKRVANETIVDGGTASLFPIDLSDAQAVARVAERITREIGTPDILVNNAGEGNQSRRSNPNDGIAILCSLLCNTCISARNATKKERTYREYNVCIGLQRDSRFHSLLCCALGNARLLRGA
jgi:NAD(P)-dependent dehydrogenase (short-subunit alcohol dehydrogenase family)